MKFAKIVFVVAGIYGLITLIPAYFLEIYVGIVDPPPITHPEYFYGFLGVAIAWQVAFLVIASDPKRYRPLMLVALLEKVGYGAAVVVLFEAHRVELSVMAPGVVPDRLFETCESAAARPRRTALDPRERLTLCRFASRITR